MGLPLPPIRRQRPKFFWWKKRSCLVGEKSQRSGECLSVPSIWDLQGNPIFVVVVDASRSEPLANRFVEGGHVAIVLQ